MVLDFNTNIYRLIVMEKLHEVERSSLIFHLNLVMLFLGGSYYFWLTIQFA